MNFLSLAILFIFLIPIPFLAGSVVMMETKKKSSILLTWVCGYILLWAIFEIVAIPFIIKQQTIDGIVYAYMIITLLVALAGLILLLRAKATKTVTIKNPLDKTEMIYLCIFLGIVFFQLYKAIVYAYSDGDDAYYIAVASEASHNGNMYISIPYTGAPSTINMRYALAPFPIWIAYLSKISGMNVAQISHCILPVVFIPITYIIYNAIGTKLFRENREKRYLFLVFMACIQMFSNYSINTVETFLLTRSRQGKAALANIVIPFLFYLMLEILQEEEEKERNVQVGKLLFITSVVAALCSMFGNILNGIFLFAILVLALIQKKSMKTKITVVIAAIPSAAMLLLYLLIK